MGENLKSELWLRRESPPSEIRKTSCPHCGRPAKCVEMPGVRDQVRIETLLSSVLAKEYRGQSVHERSIVHSLKRSTALQSLPARWPPGRAGFFWKPINSLLRLFFGMPKIRE
jgi:hypothetical protein